MTSPAIEDVRLEEEELALPCDYSDEKGKCTSPAEWLCWAPHSLQSCPLDFNLCDTHFHATRNALADRLKRSLHRHPRCRNCKAPISAKTVDDLMRGIRL